MEHQTSSRRNSQSSGSSSTREKEKFGWCLTLLCYLACQLSGGRHYSIQLCHTLSIIFMYYGYTCISSMMSEPWKLYIVISGFEVFQWFQYQWAASSPEFVLFSLLTSTVILLTKQISPLAPMSLNLFLVCKHLVAWFAVCLEVQGLRSISLFTILNSGWALYYLICFARIRIDVLKTESEHRESIRRKDEHIAALYEALPPGIIVVTEERKVVSYNQAVLKLYKLENESGDVYEKIYEYMAQMNYLNDHRAADSKSDKLMSDILEYIVSSDRDKRSFGAVLIHGKYFEFRANKLNWEDKKASILCMRDITRWVELEATAKRESDSKSALLRSVSHELRTPTNAIINLARDINDKEQLSNVGLQDLNLLSSCSHFLLSMINDLLDYSSITNGKFGLTKQFFPLEGTVRECVQLIEFQCKYKKLELTMRYDPSLPALAYNDKNRLKQVILNLLSNAMKFTMKGKIEVVVVSVSETHAGIKVIDTGVGISEQSIGKIFKLFGKLEGNEKLNPQGCGLGLSISSMLVKSMGGSGFHVESKRKVGSIFSFEFAITKSEFSREVSDASINSPELGENMCTILVPESITSKVEVTFPDILIADDVDYNRIVLRKILEAMGYDCEEASTGVQVLERVRARADLGKPYLVILMDVEMPEMDGNTATRELMEMVNRGELGSSPVVIGCSAYSSLEDKETSLRAGMQYYLEKPVMRENLSELLSGVIPRGMFRYHSNYAYSTHRI